MPYSDTTFDSRVEDFLKKKAARKYLDIGPGAGKYGKMIRRIFKNAYIVAIESEKSYISKFKLNGIYDEIVNSRAEKFIDKNPRFTTDIAIIGDCLEHLRKSDGVDLIHYLVYRSRYIILVFPSKFIQYDWKGHVSESHNSVWNESDFKLFDYRYYKKGFMNLVIISGYVGDPEAEYPKG